MAEIFLGEIGQRVNLRAATGAAFPPFRLQAQYADGSPIDITGGDLHACIWRVHSAPQCCVGMLTVTPADPAQGAFDLSMSRADVTALSEIALLDVTRRAVNPYVFEWAIFMNAADNVYARRLFFGALLLY